ncbi:unnamed protein product [Prunus armeniaca]
MTKEEWAKRQPFALREIVGQMGELQPVQQELDLAQGSDGIIIGAVLQAEVAVEAGVVEHVLRLTPSKLGDRRPCGLKTPFSLRGDQSGVYLHAKRGEAE